MILGQNNQIRPSDKPVHALVDPALKSESGNIGVE
jgi:hypothetical protein